MKTRNLQPCLPPLSDPTIIVTIRLGPVVKTYGCYWFSVEEHDHLLLNNIVEDFGLSPVDFDELAKAEILVEKDDEFMCIHFDTSTYTFKAL